ncbi:DUF4260 domain-containing protein [Aureimonas mangrovi]|uniref:DUF4260 domain-containing protein n=1 Tax=Aureimonas mangrovi TaxID=2758041 RepID=UPI00163DC692|nr:DUF4260 domain-containing protein [Aureimonas mangrovi]
MKGGVSGTPRLLLRLEGLAVLAAATIAYAGTDAGWWMFAVLFLAPDLSILGYVFGARAGAAVYNAGHAYLAPAVLVALGIYGPAPQVLSVGLVWAAHIGFDRALGYGLKYPEGFPATHLGPLGGTRGRD